MDKNFIIAIVLMTIIMLFYFSPQYQQRYGRELPQKQAVESTESEHTPENSTKPGSPQETIPLYDTSEEKVSSVQAEDTPRQIQIETPTEESEFSLTNEDISVTISTRGGVIKKVTMRNFNGSEDTEPAQILTEGEAWYDGHITDTDGIVDFSDIIFSEESRTPTTVTLHASLIGNRTITREFVLDSTMYMLHTRTILQGNWQEPTVHFNWSGPINETEAEIKKLRIWPFTMFMRDDTTAFNKLVYLGQGDRILQDVKRDEKKSRIYADKSQRIEARKRGDTGQDTFTGDLTWYAVRSKYFMTAAIPKEKMRWNAVSEYQHSTDGKWFDFSISKQVSDGNTDLDIYVGPISYDVLKQYDEKLTELMELSWRFVRPLSILFLWLLKNIHAVIPNWGLVIIAFSLIIKLVLYPLSHKSFESMKKMSALQPEITVLREKHKNNPQKLHQATMELYKREGVNPFSGCLPMLLQMPVFFALYPVVGRSFELRQAMFIPRWIEDLSRPDPLYILPVAMGISMFLQSKQSMKDPNQKAMLYVMPVMMVFLFANFSSGLTLYWLLFNVMSFLQQKIHKTPLRKPA